MPRLVESSIMRGFIVPMPGGDAGTRATVHHMRRLARAGALAPVVRQTAARLVLGLGPADGDLACRLVGEWVGNHVLFLPDPVGAEALHDPAWCVEQVLRFGAVQVDCDDVAMLAAALGMSVGLRARFQVVAFSPNGPYQHVWCDLRAPGAGMSWWQIDPTRPLQNLGAAVARTWTIEV